MASKPQAVTWTAGRRPSIVSGRKRERETVDGAAENACMKRKLEIVELRLAVICISKLTACVKFIQINLGVAIVDTHILSLVTRPVAHLELPDR